MKKSLLELIMAACLVFALVVAGQAANSLVTDVNNFEGAAVDTDPGATGYGTAYIKPLTKNDRGEIGFVVYGGTATVDLQFRIGSGAWETEGQYTAGDAKNIYDNTDARTWRAWVLDNNQGTGTTYFGFTWGEGPRY